ncbi:hypothetical protein IWW39_002170 [Coemansia spiralis]|uniref:Uncharacterized protein n=1 Tax=Coemansia spiralis TaxID=417178 RepID=A0A9W8L5G3_9FUNG|nr:hypothetical protein IWW39_002170 [Coemansia spiralis]
MSIQLTKGLLSAFVESASGKARQTLSTDNTLTPLVFANSVLLWLVPSYVNHPLRRVLGLSTPFIIISALASERPEQPKLSLSPTRNVVCGTDPLAIWSSLASAADGVRAMSQYSHDWSIQRLEPLDRNQARMLTAQYAQILPELCRGDCDHEHGDDRTTELALPMLVFTREIEQVAAKRPFYLAVFSPNSPSDFANVIAIRHAGSQASAGAQSLSERNGMTRYSTVQHWAEYDLLGSPAYSTELIKDDDARFLAGLSARSAPGGQPNHPDIDRMDLDDSGETESVSSECLSASTSFVTLHSVWAVEPKDGNCIVNIPPLPTSSAQWMLELVSTPLALEPEANKSLKALGMEIKRLETWCACWMSGTKWVDTSRKDGDTFSLHPWQALERHHKGDAGASSRLSRHRELFGKRVDEFLDASINDTRGSSTLGPPGRAKDAHSLDVFPVRKDMDFTERLWNLSHYAYDDSDLSEVIEAIAEGLETRQLQPYIRHSHADRLISPLAQLIRNSLQMAQQKTLVDEKAERERLAAQLDLWIEEQPLDAFVNIGLHKLRADFWFYFVTAHLATPKQMESYLSDQDMDPSRLIAGFWKLLRVLEAWWLVQQAVPGMPRHFVLQIVGALLSYFEAADAADPDSSPEDKAGSEDDHDSGSAACLYETRLRVTMYLPLYSAEVQEFVASIVDGFDPARYAVAAMGDLSAVASKCRLIQLTRNPAQVDLQFSNENGELIHDQLPTDDDAPTDDGNAAEDNYAMFEARLF